MAASYTNDDGADNTDGMLDVGRLRELLNYDPETGVFTWRVARKGRFKGSVAGSTDSNGYRTIRLDDVLYLEHRLAVLYMIGEWPKATVDHINGERADNRWTNLREATWSQNLANRSPNKNNTSGAKGVWWNKRRSKWTAAVTVDRKAIHLGYFLTVGSAEAAYKEAAKRYFGEFAA